MVREAVASVLLPKLRWRRISLNFLLAESSFFDKIGKPTQTMQIVFDPVFGDQPSCE
jgi:hypothetical protein